MATGTRTENPQDTHVERWVATSGANSALSVSTGTDPSAPRRVLAVYVAYSGSPTQTGVTFTLDSGAGAGYDTLISTGQADSRYTVWRPGGGILLMPDDVLTVVAPAGGGSLTSSVSIYTEMLNN